MRQSEREKVLTELKAVREELAEIRGGYATSIERIEAIDRTLARTLDEVEPWLTIADVCDLQKVSIEEAMIDCFYLPHFGTRTAGPKGWRRETVREWIANLESHRHAWVMMNGARKEKYRSMLREEVA